MSDFLAALTTQYAGSDLLSLLKEPYSPNPPDGYAFDYQWGSLAVLEDHYGIHNVRLDGDTTVFWLGDFACDMSDHFVDDLVESLQNFRAGLLPDPARDRAISRLNGAFTFGIADDTGLCVITDPRSFVSVYAAFHDKDCIAVGTHLDLVAAACGAEPEINLTHAAEFLNFGTVCFPHTIYENIRRLEGATIFDFAFNPNRKFDLNRAQYWHVPDELQGSYNEQDLADELRSILTKAVYNRCRGSRLAVTLSGGLDSRLILAQIPRALHCDSITFCDSINRETRIAQQVAAACSRSWQPFFRDEDFLANNLVQTVKLIGCQGLFAYAHMVGFADRFKNAGYTSILGGTQMDTYLKAYYAQDIVRLRSWNLRSQFVKVPFDFIYGMTSFWKGVFASRLIDDVYDSRKQFYNSNISPYRGSQAEWLFLNPVDMMLISFKAERRVVPTRLVALDKDILEFCFKCPIELKLDRRIFLQAALPLFGSAAFIPTADKGIAPAAGQLAKLTRRAVRKIIDSTTDALASVGIEPTVQHSWHDYQHYWQQSHAMRLLVQTYAPRLDQFTGPLFNVAGQDLLNRADIEWHHAFRLLQFAVWLDVAKSFRSHLIAASSSQLKRKSLKGTCQPR